MLAIASIMVLYFFAGVLNVKSPFIVLNDFAL